MQIKNSRCSVNNKFSLYLDKNQCCHPSFTSKRPKPNSGTCCTYPVCALHLSLICNLFGKVLLNSLDKNAFECQNIVSVSNRLLVLMSSLIPCDRYFYVNLMEVIYSSRKITMQFRILNCHKYYHSK